MKRLLLALLFLIPAPVIAGEAFVDVNFSTHMMEIQLGNNKTIAAGAQDTAVVDMGKWIGQWMEANNSWDIPLVYANQGGTATDSTIVKVNYAANSNGTQQMSGGAITICATTVGNAFSSGLIAGTYYARYWVFYLINNDVSAHPCKMRLFLPF